MVFGGSRVENTNLPPKPPSHLDLEWWQTEVAAVSVYSERLRDAYNQTSQRPDLARVIVAPHQDEEDDKRLQYDNLIAVEEVCPRQGLFQSKSISIQQCSSVFSPSFQTGFRGGACYGAVVYGKQERFQPFAYFIGMCEGVEDGRLEGGNVQDLD